MEKEIHYTIDKPNPETNIFALIIKYLVLGISSVVGLAIVIPLFVPFRLFYIGQSSDNKTLIYFIILGAVVTFIFIRHFLRKFKLSKIYDIRIDNTDNCIYFKAINNMNGKEENRTVSFENLTVNVRINAHPLYGTQRKIILYENNKLFNIIQLDLDGWNRTEFIDEMIENILKIDENFVENIESNYG